MKILRIIVLVLTAAVAFSACDSPTDVTDKQNVIPIGATPIKSVTVDVQKAVTKEVNNTFKGMSISTQFNPENSYIDLNSKMPYLTLKLDADVPVTSLQSGVHIKNFSLNMKNVVADGRPYFIQGGISQSFPATAEFNTVTFYQDQGQTRNMTSTITPIASDSAIIRFTHDPVNRAIIGNLMAYMTKDTVIRVPMDIDSTQAEAVFAEYEAKGFEVKNPVYFTVEGKDVVFDAIQVLLNVKSSITVQY